MSDPGQESVLIVGNYQTCEMSVISDAVKDICVDAQVRYFTSVSTIPVEIVIPEVVIICQNWPDEFSICEVNELVNRFPLSRFICCYSVWCESDGRTRSTWPVSVRVPARSVSARIQHEWDVVHGIREVFPLTSGRDEIFQIETSTELFKLKYGNRTPLVCIISGDCHYRAMLQEMITSWQGQVLDVSQMDEADLIIYDLDPWELVSANLAVQEFKSPVVGVMGLAHPETVVDARRSGCEMIVCKVAPEGELFQAIEHILKIKAIPLAEH